MKKIINAPENYVDEMLEGIYTAHPDLVTYVGGDLRTESIHFINGQHIFVGGSLYVDRSLEMESHCVVTVGCKIVAEKFDANGGDTYIESTYIKADTTFLGSSGSIDPAVCLPDGGVADLGHLSIGGTNTFFHVPSDDATALVNCDECYLTNILDVSQAIDGHFYFNYGKLSSHAEGQITIADSSKVNVATINEEWAEECNPGFTVGGGDTPYIKVSIHVQKDDKAQANSATPIYPGIR